MSSAGQVDLSGPLAQQADVVRLVVLADIHATERGSPPTNVSAAVTDPTANALVGARELLRKEVVTADLVLCPGDLVQGYVQPIDWVWQHLLDAASDLGATLVGSAGNHDLLREPSGGQTPSDALRALLPRFPLPDQAQFNSYWGADFGVVSGTDWRVVTMNTCALHGGFDRGEADFGRFRSSCLRDLRVLLEHSGGGPAVNICMIHHHPVEWTHQGDRQATHLLCGDLLIDLLGERPERWTVVHGHKHHPALGYLGRATNGPIWLSAGSVGADVLGDTGTTVRNQMHVVDVACDAPGVFGLTAAGEIQSFDWEPGHGWTPARPDSGLPARCGFGYRRDGLELVGELRRHLQSSSRTSIHWREVVGWDPRFHFLVPADRAAFLAALRRHGGGVAGHDDDTLEVTLP